MGNSNKKLWRKPLVKSRASPCGMSPKYIWTLSAAVVLGSCPRLRIRPWAMKFAFAELSILCQYSKTMLRQPQDNTGRDVQDVTFCRGHPIVITVFQVHFCLWDLFQSLSCETESNTWTVGRKSTGEGVGPCISKTTGFPCTLCSPG